MDTLDRFELSIESLMAENQHFEYDINDDFFEAVEAGDIHKGSLKITIATQKMAQNVDLHIVIDGTVGIPCDRCLDPMDHPVDVSHRLTVKLGNERSEDDDLIVVTDDDPVVDLAWVVYETIVLNLPVKHVHAPGKCNPAMINVLSEHSATRSDYETETKTVDPRWSALAKLQQADQDNTEIDNKN